MGTPHMGAHPGSLPSPVNCVTPLYIGGYIGIMENEMETIRVYRDSIGYIMVYSNDRAPDFAR